MRIALASLLIAGLALTGCSSPEAHTEVDPSVFKDLSPAQQALVEQGQVAPGFDADAVRLALGDPDAIATRTDAEGDAEVWRYSQYEAEGKPLFTGYFHRDRSHGFGWNGYWGKTYPYYLNYPDRTLRGRLTVVFRDGRVSAVIPERQ